jgi:hypothetical protein
MRAIAGFILFGLAVPVVAQDRLEIDPNTKIQGGADMRGSGASAGAGARPDNEIESGPRLEERRNVARPDKDDPKEDKPISERKPREREPEEGAAKGGTARPQ